MSGLPDEIRAHLDDKVVLPDGTVKRLGAMTIEEHQQVMDQLTEHRDEERPMSDNNVIPFPRASDENDPFTERVHHLLDAMEDGDSLLIQITKWVDEDGESLRVGFALGALGKPHMPDPSDPKFGADESPMWLQRDDAA